MKSVFIALAMTVTAVIGLPEIKVAENRRHLVTAEGKPFFLLGDTAWELFHRLTREEAELYLKNRADKGFNTIFAVALAEHEFHKPNAYGEMPLENNDPARPRDAYFRHVDWIVDRAASLGLYTAILPTWGDKWNQKWGAGPEIFTWGNAMVYGEWLGRRYRDKPVIWILGGDRPVETGRHRAIIHAMAAGLKKGDGGRHLISYHPHGGANSSDFWPNEAWLDFHIFQSGHVERAVANYDMNARNLGLKPLKPTLDGEPCYEDHPVRGLMVNGKPTEWFDDYDVRRAAWWNVLSGACGHVYGAHGIWQFHDPVKRKALTDVRTSWQQSLDLPGATQMGVMRRFIEGLEWTKLRRADRFLPEHAGGPARPVAAVATDGSFALIYVPDIASGIIAPDLGLLSFQSNEIRISAFDPATGRATSDYQVVGSAIHFRTDRDSIESNETKSRNPKDRVLLFTRRGVTGNPANP